MKPTVKKLTYIEKKKQEYASNQAYIQKAVNLTDLEYYNTAFETACLFLEYLFPRDTTRVDYYRLHAYHKAFWIWWKAQWHKWESEFVAYVKCSPVVITKTLWLEDIQQMITDSHVESSFHHNYRKLIQHQEREELRKKN